MTSQNCPTSDEASFLSEEGELRRIVAELRAVELASCACVQPVCCQPASDRVDLASFDTIMPEKKMHEVIQMSKFVASLYSEHGCQCLGNTVDCLVW